MKRISFRFCTLEASHVADKSLQVAASLLRTSVLLSLIQQVTVPE